VQAYQKPERRSLSSILDSANSTSSSRKTLPTGFTLLDRVIGGGLRTRNLTLLGGAPGVGKTITTLQWARNLAKDGASVVFACYEHDEVTLLSRLLHLELGELPAEERLGESGRTARRVLDRVEEGQLSLPNAVIEAPVLEEPYRQIQKYSDRLWLVQASGAHTTLAALEDLVGPDTDALFVDYLQKVPMETEVTDERDRVTLIAQGLKELAMSKNVAVVAISAASKDGLDAPRLRLHHLRGSTAIGYEADVVVILNDKYDIVSKSQMTQDLAAAEGFKHKLIFTVEKNRGGSDMVDLEFKKQFDYLRVDPEGKHVTERLIDERIFTE